MAWLKSYFYKFLGLMLITLFFTGVANGKEARPKYKVQKIQIQMKTIKVEIAESEAEHEYGLMFVKKLEKNSGMLFVFSDDKVRNFWMKNTLIPLSIGFFNSEKSLISIHEMTPYVENMGAPQIYSSGSPARYALEMNRNWFSENKIKLGDKFQSLK